MMLMMMTMKMLVNNVEGDVDDEVDDGNVKFTWPCTLSLASPLYVDNLVKEKSISHYHCSNQSKFSSS